MVRYLERCLSYSAERIEISKSHMVHHLIAAKGFFRSVLWLGQDRSGYGRDALVLFGVSASLNHTFLDLATYRSDSIRKLSFWIGN